MEKTYICDKEKKYLHKMVEEELDTEYPNRINSNMAELMGWKRVGYGWTNLGCGRGHHSSEAWYRDGYAFMYDVKKWNPFEDLNQLMMVVEYVVKKEKEIFNADVIEFYIDTDFEADDEGNSCTAWIQYWNKDIDRVITAIGKKINDTLVKLIYAITEEWE